MKSVLSRFAFAAAMAVSCLVRAQAAEPAIIAKARAFLGGNAALDAVNSVRYTGTLSESLSSDPSKVTTAALEIIVQKPDQQRVTSTTAKVIEITGLDGYEGWQRIVDTTNPKNKKQGALNPDVLRRVRAQARENLLFFGGFEKIGGQYDDLGKATVDGIECQKIGFVHSPTIVFYRYFDLATGRLVLTETSDGSATREEGEQRENGVRFPKGMTITAKLPNGTSRITKIVFEKITVNEKFPASTFAFPPIER